MVSKEMSLVQGQQSIWKARAGWAEETIMLTEMEEFQQVQVHLELGLLGIVESHLGQGLEGQGWLLTWNRGIGMLGKQ
jgi:hypothetical protein